MTINPLAWWREAQERDRELSVLMQPVPGESQSEKADRLIRAVALLAQSLGIARRILRFVVWVILFDVLVTALLYTWHSRQNDINHRQDCASTLAGKLFQAEFAKVSGQIDGLQRVKTGKVDPGLNQFIAASQHYLDTIARLNADHC